MRSLAYNIFMQTNISAPDVFRVLGQPIRIQIILIIASYDACVCHMEAVLGVRQAGISQHLMVLKDAGLVQTHREGRNIFYRLANPDLYTSVLQVAIASGTSQETLASYAKRPVEGCPCPTCNPGIDAELTCGKLVSSQKKKSS